MPRTASLAAAYAPKRACPPVPDPDPRVDDHPAARGGHRRVHGLHEEERRAWRGVEHQVVIVGGDVDEGFGLIGGDRVVDQCVDPPERGHRGIDDAARALLIPQIGQHRLAGEIGEFDRRGRQPLLLVIDQECRRSAAEQGPGDALADALSRAGDDRDSARQRLRMREPGAHAPPPVVSPWPGAAPIIAWDKAVRCSRRRPVRGV
jgi:hypothetical protein